jgi:very-short-patch-repair endonuclease
MLRLTTEDFIKKSRNIHGDKYDYSLVKYINSYTKIKIICPKHGVFEQNPYSHYNGTGCIRCTSNYVDIKIFIEKSRNIHGDEYDYSLVDYINNHTKVKIICSKHGVFKQEPNGHLNGAGCPKCDNKNVTTEEFIEKAKEIHGNKYDYSLTIYKNSKLKIKIICSIHGIFKQKPANHLNGSGCSKCGIILRNNKLTHTKEEFVIKSNKIHNNKYDYSLAEYKHNKKNIIIICPIHGKFEQIPNDHLQGVGCPKCKQSKGEAKINQILENNNIFYICQKTFNDCKDIRKLQFDFYLPEQKSIIEYDGIQHYKPINYFGGIKSLKSQQKRDQIKTNYCIENNINLIRIRYDENIEDKLTPILIKK